MSAPHQMLLSYPAPTSDPSWANVVGLWHFEASDGTTPPFTNSATHGALGDFIATGSSGSPTISTTHPGFGLSSYKSVASTVKTAAGNTLSTIGTGDFTLEFLLYYTAQQTKNVIDLGDQAGAGIMPVIYTDTGGNIYWYQNSTNRITGTGLVLNAQNAIAVSRVSGSTRMFRAGSQVGSTYTDSTNMNTTGIPLVLGASSTQFTGWMDELRLTIGVGRYTTTYTPATAAFPNS